MNLRNIYILCFTLFFAQNLMMAQDQRSFETKVADALVAMPADNFESYNRIMENLVNQGPDVVGELIKLYKASQGDEKARIEFAFSGLGKYLSSTSEAVRTTFADAFITSLEEGRGDHELAHILLEELILFLPATEIGKLGPFLQDREHQMRVLDVLEGFPGDETGKLILEGMDAYGSRSKFKAYKILSNPEFGMAGEVLKPENANSRTELGQIVMNGMAESGSEDYFSFFQNLITGVPDAFSEDMILKYAERFSENEAGNKSFSLLQAVFSSNELSPAFKGLALKAMVKVNPAKSVEFLKKGLKADDDAIAVAAAHSLDDLDANYWNALGTTIGQASPMAKSNAVRILSGKGWIGTSDLARALLNDPDTLVRAEAIKALAVTGGTDVQDRILDFVSKNSNETVLKAGVAALKMVTNTDNAGKILNVLSDLEDNKKSLLIPVVGMRGHSSHFGSIYKIAQASSGDLQVNALAALAKLGGDAEVSQMIDLLKHLKEENVEAGQSALERMLSAGESSIWASDLSKAIDADDNTRFIPFITHLQGDAAHSMASQILRNGDDEKRNLLLNTLSSWHEEALVDDIVLLLDNQATRKNAYKALMETIDGADWPVARKLLYFNKYYNAAVLPDEKTTAVRKLGAFKDFYALILAGKHLEDRFPDVRNAAAMAIMSIVMPGPQNDDGMTGEVALNLLKKARDMVTGNDASYFKENIDTYIESVSDNEPGGFVPMFNGKDLSGWHGFVDNPVKLKEFSAEELEVKSREANEMMKEHWWVENEQIRFKGDGKNLVSDRQYGNFIMLVDWQIDKDGDSGIYLRGTPQVQIWDTARVDVGAQVGSGGLYNNKEHESKPLKLADMAIGDWNHMKIAMFGEKVSVWLNGEKVVDNVVMENYWDRSIPIFPVGTVELQAHGTNIGFRNLYIMEISSGEDLMTEEEKKNGFMPIFNGYDLEGWVGNKTQYTVKNGMIVVDPEASGNHGNLFTEKEYEDFHLKFEFQLTPGANNGLGIHAPLSGDVAYSSKEIQILDNTASIYANLQPYQYHGSLYGIAPAKRGYLKPVGDWNEEEVVVENGQYKVILNGTEILNVNLKEVSRKGTMDGKKHPGVKKDKGHIGFLGHGSEVKFRNLRIKEL